MATKVPFDYSYWAIPGKLLAGSYPGYPDPVLEEQRLMCLIEVGITLVVNLMEEVETDHTWKAATPYEPVLAKLSQASGAGIRVLRHAIVDFSIPTVAQMKEILGVMHTEIAAGGRVYVHCFGGLGRTGTVVGCYLAEQGDAKALETLAALTAHEPYFKPTPITDEQRKFVSDWIK